MGTEDYEDITGQRVARAIECATNGDRDAAFRLMDEFRQAVENGQTVSPELLRYFANCFRKILDGCKPDAALHIKKPSNRPQDPELWVRDVTLALAVEEARSQGMTLDKAFAKVAQKHHASESTIRRAYAYYKN